MLEGITGFINQFPRVVSVHGSQLISVTKVILDTVVANSLYITTVCLVYREISRRKTSNRFAWLPDHAERVKDAFTEKFESRSSLNQPKIYG